MADADRGTGTQQRVAAILVLVSAVGWTIVGTARAHDGQCGGAGQSACDCFGEGRCCICGDPACDSGTREVFAPACGVGGAPSCHSEAISWCVAISACGGDGERACCIGEGDTCDDGLTEQGNCKNELGLLNCGGCSIGVCKPKNCGGAGQSACDIFTGEPACDSGLTQIFVPACGVGDAPDCVGVATTWCADITSCGGDGERACCLFEDTSIGACESGLIENGNCKNELGSAYCLCGSGLASSIGVCKAPDCGGDGERGCCLLERIPSCDSGLIEDLTPGCESVLGSGNCDCGFGLGKSLGVCRALKGVGERGCDPFFDPCASDLVCRAVGADVGDTMCVPKQGDKLFGDELCAALYVPALHQGAILSGITTTYGVAGTASAFVSATAEVGVAYTGADQCYGCYLTTCGGINFDVSIGIAACFGQTFDGLWGSVAGNTCAISLGAEFPFTEIGASITTVHAGSTPVPHPGDCVSVPVGIAECFSVGLGLNPLPVDGAIELCHTFTNLVGCFDDTVSGDGDLVLTPDEPPTCADGLTLGVCPNSAPITMFPLAVDPDGDPLTYSWSSTCGGSFDDASAAAPQFTFSSAPTCSELDCMLTVSATGNVVDGETTTPTTVTCSAAVTDDFGAPEFSSFPADTSIECSDSTDPANTGSATATDTCDSSPSVTHSDSVAVNGCAHDTTITRTWTAQDSCGNQRMQDQIITLTDTAAPTVSCPSDVFWTAAANPTGCESAVTYSVTASDACDSAPVISCSAPGATGVSESGGTFPVGTTTVTCSATDDCGNTGTSCSFDVIVNDPPQITSVSLSTQEVQYSDKIVEVVVTATDCGPGNSLTLEFDAADVPNGLALSSTADACGTNGAGLVECTWTLSNNDRVLEPEGTYVIDGIKAVDPTPLNGVTLKSSPAESITIDVKAENATIAFDGGNPVAVQVATDGGNSGTFDLTVHVQELYPEIATAGGELPGDIGLAVVAMTLAPVGPGGGAVGTCTPNNDPTPLDYTGALTVTCEFDNVAVNTYTVEAVLVADGSGDLFYTGSNEDVLVIFDPSLGFTTGGGHFLWPGTYDRTNFGYTMKYNKRWTKVQGSLLLIRHLPDGTKYRVKSNALYGLAIGDGVNNGPFGWASFAGKCTYLDPSLVDPLGNHSFVVYVEDHGEPGAGVDKLWLQTFDRDEDVIGDLSMNEAATSNAETIVGGNIVVPHTPTGTD